MTVEQMLAEGEWDLGEILAERAQPTDEVYVYLNEVASFAKARLSEERALAKPEDQENFDELLSIAEEDLQKSKWTFYLTAVPSRMREDIRSKAMAEHPVKASLLGFDDPVNQRERTKYENNLYWLAQITNVTNPDGKSKRNWDIESIDQMAHSLPTFAQEKIDNALQALTKDAEKFTAESKNLDF